MRKLRIALTKGRLEKKSVELFEKMGGKSVYVTDYRNNMSTGMTDDELADELLTLAKSGAALVDVMGDLYCPSRDEITRAADAKQRELINKIHSYGAEVLMSSHTYRFLNFDEVWKIAKIQSDRSADIVKIVAAASSERELYEIF